MGRKLFLILIFSWLTLSFTSAYATTPAPKKWTFLIFLNGNNSLDHYGKKNIEAMEQVGSNDQVNIVVQWASESAGKTVRLLIQKSNDPTKVTSPIVQDLGMVDMGDVKTLKDFIQWGIQNYPAEHYFIDVWDHGTGWHEAPFPHPSITNNISQDDNTGNSITTEQLANAIGYAAHLIGHKVDIYGSDACFMAMIEIADQMPIAAKYYLGSQETESGKGWPYADFLSAWEALPDATPKQVARILVRTYVKSYEHGSSGKHSATLSAYDLSKLSSLNQAIAALGEAIRAGNTTAKIATLIAARNSQNFAEEDYVDLLDFTKHLSSSVATIDPRIIANVQTAANDFIVADKDTPDYKDATGISIWLPTDYFTYREYSSEYKKLKFDEVTKWGDTLDFLLHGVYERK